MHPLVRWSVPAAAVAVVLVSAVSGSQQEVQVGLVPVSGKVSMLQEQRSGNIGVLIGDDGILLVDSQFQRHEPAIRARLAELQEGSVDYLINTHYHGDHTDGNRGFGGEAVVVAHDNVRRRLVEGDRPMAPEGLPEITFAQSTTLHFNGEEVRLLHFPGCHTDGDTVVHFVDSNVLHMGDMFFQGRFPYVDLGSGGNVLGLLEAVSELCDTLPDEITIIPGHGDVTDVAGLREYRDMIEATLDHVAAAMDEGKSKKEIQDAGLPPEYKSWSWGFIPEPRWIDTLYTSLEGG